MTGLRLGVATTTATRHPSTVASSTSAGFVTPNILGPVESTRGASGPMESAQTGSRLSVIRSRGRPRNTSPERPAGAGCPDMPPRMEAGTLHPAATAVAVMVGMEAGRRSSQGTIHLDFGIVEFALVGPHAEEVYVVRLTCGCVGLIAQGRMIRRAGGIALVCAHVAATWGCCSSGRGAHLAPPRRPETHTGALGCRRGWSAGPGHDVPHHVFHGGSDIVKEIVRLIRIKEPSGMHDVVPVVFPEPF